MTYSLSAYQTRIDIILSPDGRAVTYGVIAEHDNGPPLVLMQGRARIRDCNFTFVGMEPWPNLNLGDDTEIRLVDIDDVRRLSEYLSIPMPLIDPARCKSQQGTLS